MDNVAQFLRESGQAAFSYQLLSFYRRRLMHNRGSITATLAEQKVDPPSSETSNYIYLRQELARQLLEFVRKRDADRFLFGMALGVDSMAFDVCTKMREQLHPDLRLVAAVPYANQAQHWDPEHRQRYRRRLELADEVVMVDELPDYAVAKVPIGAYDPAKLLARNQYMVDHVDVVYAVWTEVERGGTYDAVCRAKQAGKELIVHNPKKLYVW